MPSRRGRKPFAWLALLSLALIQQVHAQTGPSLPDSLGPYVWVTDAGGSHVFTVTRNSGGLTYSGDLTYSFSPALPSGLTVTHNTPPDTGQTDEAAVIDLTTYTMTSPKFEQTGTAAVMNSATYTMTVTDENGDSDSAMVAIEVVAAVPTFTQAVYNFTFVQGTAKTVTLPQASGDAMDDLIYQIGTQFDGAVDEQIEDAGFTLSAKQASFPITVTSKADTPANNGFGYQFYGFFQQDIDSPSGVGITTISFFVASVTPTFTVTQSDITFTAAQATSFTLEKASIPVTNPLTYDLTTRTKETLPQALMFDADADARQLRSTNSIADADEGVYILSATNSDGTAETTFAITVEPQPTFPDAQAPLIFSVGQSSTYTLVQASSTVGGLVYTFTRESDMDMVPAELIFDSASRQLSSTNMVAADDAGNYIITATDPNGASASTTFAITVLFPPTFSATQDDLTFTIGTIGVYTLVSATAAGGGVVTYSVAGLPMHLTFDAASRTLSYLGSTNPFMQAFGEANPYTQRLVLTAFDSFNAPSSVNFAVQFVNEPSFTGGFALLNDGYSFRVGTAIAANTTLPQATYGTEPFTYQLTAGAGSTYDANSFAANGINFDAASLTLSGTPIAEAVHPLAYHARDYHGATASQDTAIYAIGALALAQPNLAFNTATKINQPLGAASNTIGAISYALTDIAGGGLNLPSGVTYDEATHQLGGTTPATKTGATFVLTATDAFDDTRASATFQLGVFQASFESAINAATFTVGVASFTAGDALGATLTIPVAQSDVGELVYAIGVNTLPDDLRASVQSDHRVLISGIPQSVGNYTYTRIAADFAGRMLTFAMAIHVARAPQFDRQAELQFTNGHFAERKLVEASGGFGGFSYSLAPPLPNGLTFSNVNPPTIRGIATLSLSGAVYTLTAFDAHGASDSTTLTFQVDDAAQFSINAAQSFTVGGPGVKLPFLGAPNYTYQLNGLENQLAFDEREYTIAGPLTITSPSQISPLPVLTYIVTDRNAAAATAVFTLHIIPLTFEKQTRYLSLPGNAVNTYNLKPLNLRYAAGGEVRYKLEPDIPGLIYRPAQQQLISDATFSAESATHTLTLTAEFVSQNDVVYSATQTLVLQVTAEEFRDVNAEILSKVAGTSVAATLGAITDRIAGINNTTTPAATIGGHSPLMALVHNAKAYADGVLDEKALLNNSNFVLPLQAGAVQSGAAFWGGANYRKVEGNSDTVDWSGAVDGAHLGADYRRNSLLFGVAIAKSESDIDFERASGETGDYGVSISSQYQYINWQHGGFNLWLSAGVGDGELTIRQEGKEDITGDLELSAAGVGANIALSPHMQLRGEYRGGEVEIGGNEAQTLLDQTIRTSSGRLLAQWRSRPLDEKRAAFIELGARNDGGDGDGGAAIESALGWHYRGERATLELGAHGLFGRENYSESGAYGQLRISGGADGQGLSLRVRPSYGEAQRKFGKVWNAESLDEIDAGGGANNTAYRWRAESRLAYGMQIVGGLFAPFGEIITAEDAGAHLYRLGADWSPHRYFDLNLTGERRADDQRIVVQGEVKF